MQAKLVPAGSHLSENFHSSESERFWVEHSLLNQTRLDRFILISFALHVAVIIIQGIIPAKSSDPHASKPIQVKFLKPEEPKQELNQGTIIDAAKPEKIEKPKSSELLASHDSRAHSNEKKSREYKRDKTIVPKAAGAEKTKKKSSVPPQKPSPQPVARESVKKSEETLPMSDQGTFLPLIEKSQQAKAEPSESSGSKGALSLLDGFDPDKYASLETKSDPVLEDTDDDEAVSLDTTETKYASYFARIKHQIERVWTYPIEAAQRGISGKLTLRFKLSKEGNLIGVRLVDKSGYEILDYAAVRAVKAAAPFYPFPQSIKKDKLSILATFIYSPTYGLLEN